MVPLSKDPHIALSQVLTEQRAQQILQAGPQAHITVPRTTPGRLEWWTTSDGTVPVERTPTPDGRASLSFWTNVTLWI